MAGEDAKSFDAGDGMPSHKNRLFLSSYGHLFGKKTSERALCVGAATLALLALAAGIFMLVKQEALVQPHTLIWFVVVIVFSTDVWRMAARERQYVRKLVQKQDSGSVESARDVIGLNFKFLICFYIVIGAGFLLLAFAKHIK